MILKHQILVCFLICWSTQIFSQAQNKRDINTDWYFQKG